MKKRDAMILKTGQSIKCDEQCKRHGMKDIQAARSPNNKCLCVKRVWPMRRRVNLTSVLRSGITDHAPMTGFTECSLLSNC
ncbi:hypothetical protein TNCV_5075021 [Trichonephila clavipes]|nr:hypothetical protein TNCV_5075021 [Trichonephila clavipes]